MFVIIGSKLDIGLIIDNFIKNSIDWGANNFWINCSKRNNTLIVDIYDDGKGLSDRFKEDPNEIFNFATTAKKNGTGFGIYLIRESLKVINATVKLAENINNKGIHFQIIFV